mgnify:CR=1 FL=1
MTRWLAVLALVGAGCYQDPDYGGTQFRCDPAHACPAGQQCVAGLCTRADAPVDAPGAVVDGPPSGLPDGVACGGVVCPSTQWCCAPFMGLPRCVTATAACDGVAAACDGVEDCGGQACCEDVVGEVASCTTARTCSVAREQLCRSDADCTDPGAARCCLGAGVPPAPWGLCEPMCP